MRSDVSVAEETARFLGYASYQDLYDTDVGARGLWWAELYVVEEARRRGAGDNDTRIICLDGAALETLAVTSVES